MFSSLRLKSSMPPKRTRRTSPVQASLSAGERLKRAKLAGNDFSAWGWVGTEVTDVSAISSEHRLAACGFRKNNTHPFCPNVHSRKAESVPSTEKTRGELDDDVIVISDDESPSCSMKHCKINPYCINYLGQEKWENEGEQIVIHALWLNLKGRPGKAQEAFLKLAKLGDNPYHNSRDAETPVGLKVGSSLPLVVSIDIFALEPWSHVLCQRFPSGGCILGNTHLHGGSSCPCQVWYQDLPFRSGVYQCLPSPDEQTKFEVGIILVGLASYV